MIWEFSDFSLHFFAKDPVPEKDAVMESPKP